MATLKTKGRGNLSTNPSFEGAGANIEVRRNLLINPGFRDTSRIGWTNNLAANSPVIVASVERDSGFVYRMNTISSYGPGVVTLMYQTSVLTALVVYTCSAWVKSSKAATFSIRSNNQDKNPISVPANTWTRVTATFTNDAVNAAFGVSVSGTTWDAGDWIEIGDTLVEASGALLPFFDGGFNNWQSADLTSLWIGAANTTASILRGIRPFNAQAAYGNPVWLSTDSPHHGQKFARTIVKTIGAIGAFIYSTDTAGVIAGEQMTYETNYRVSRTTTVQAPSCTPPSTNGGQAWPGLSAQLSTAGVWYTKRATLNPTWDDSGHFINISPANVQYGDMIDIDEHFAIRGTYAGSYFDGNSANAKWLGLPNLSVSADDTVLDPRIRLNGRANYCAYPNFSFLTSGTIATGWAAYSNGGAGSRSFTGGQHTITMTSTTGGLGRYGISCTNANTRVTAYEGENLYFSCKIDISAIAPNTDAQMLAVINFTDNTTVNWGVYRVSSTKIERLYQVPVGKTVQSVTLYCFIQDEVMPYAFSGTSTVKFSEVLVTKRMPNETWTTYPYFDGSTAGAKWTGTVNASYSLIGDMRDAVIKAWDGTSWV